ncbi:MAG: hypothetical protein LUF92_07800, partial [Clostridiales bacterium]|nr:hypothetical protein [Clostridiales bacterium]
MATRKHSLTKKLLSVLFAFVLVVGSVITVYAADDNTYDAPTEPMAVDDSIITASAHRAASPILGIMGLNATSGFGMINGSAPTTLEEAKTKAALGIWGTSLNDSPDPYYWNYFYNFYAEENGLETSSDALINTAAAASPVMADTTLVEEYGNISVSLYTRPEILVGCASTTSGTDTDGYNDQLDTIHSFTSDSEYYQEGDENYNPQLVSYQTTRITNMIQSMYNLADAIDAVKAEDPTKTTRYGDPQVIASDYEKYVYGTSAYILSEIAAGNVEKKTVAVVSALNEDGTFTLQNSESTSATSSVRYVEYAALVSDNLSNVLDSTTATVDELAGVDAIIVNNSDLSSSDITSALQDSASYNSNMMVITTSPSSLYGITMNSVENAMGLGYYVGYIYSDVLEISPVDMCAYFYEHFYHISDQSSLAKVVQTNFASVVLPSGMSGTLSSDYSAEKVEALLTQDMNYYANHTDAFDGTYINDAGWDIDWTVGIGAGGYVAEETSSTDTTAASNTTTAVKVGTTVTTGSGTSKATYKVTGSSTVTYVKTKASGKTVVIPATVTISGKKYKVT